MRILSLIFGLVILFSSCTAQENGSYKVLQQKEYQQKIESQQQIQLIDVRTPQEFADAHLENAQNINVNSSDFEQKVANLDKTQPVYIYCKSGGRSKKAGQILEQMGFTQIYDLQGGISSWRGKTVK